MSDKSSKGVKSRSSVLDEYKNLTAAQVAALLKKRWHVGLFGLSTVSGLLAGAIPAPFNWIPIGIAIVALIVGAALGLAVRPTYVELLHAAEKYDQDSSERQAAFRVIFGALLAELSNEVGIMKSNSRVSGYSHTGDAFVMLGRVSDNPNFKVAGRGVYPQDKGLIAKVWQEGTATCAALPEDLEKYVAKMEKDYDLAPEVTRKLTMKSRSLVGIRVTDKDGNPVGVVIAESMAARGVTKPTLDKIASSEAWKTICYEMITSRELLPDMLTVSEAGF